MSLHEYLGKRGLASPVSDYMTDKVRLPHGQTARQEAKLHREAGKAAADYQNKRSQAINEYNKKVASGAIRKPSRTESMLKTARGHSDNQATQAARRSLARRGIDWRTGKPIKK